MEIIKRRNKMLCKTSHGVAELEYRIEGSVMSIFYTFVPKEDRGSGIAEKLAYYAFEFAISKELKVRSDCPYITHFLEVHKDMVKYSTQ